MINAQVSELAVPDAESRQKQNRHWRRYCHSDETIRLVLGSSVHEKAAQASAGREALKQNLGRAKNRMIQINQILNQPF